MRERALTHGSSRVVRIVASEQFVSLFLVFLRPRLVFWVACYFDEVVFRGFLSIPRILTELRSEKFVWFGPSPTEPFNSGWFGRRERFDARSHRQLWHGSSSEAPETCEGRDEEVRGEGEGRGERSGKNEGLLSASYFVYFLIFN